ncbi:uncharacterized protein LOC118647253 [Monomorium pharaonis]|uniref:uncharacterized protein LOC118647253 n=1 Tax=Monomorium pharaonis TaxID=307658 RepID=UPI0017472D5E|nr:uncharacterized protein LOC118647253 [Monomorium pharaonis]XP_036147652.1 uncharacterized protein LOC118647253 [Monomorium pharaonis]XP_036147654.1 uncharacterized protein LOC118647253 [Monomorium pharaonis]
MPLRRAPPASDNIEIDDKHLRERFVTQKTYLDHCAQSYSRAADYGFKGPAGPQRGIVWWPSHFHNGSHLSSPALSTALVSLPPFPLRSFLPSSRRARGPLTRPSDGISLPDGSHPSPFRARNLELPLASRIALLFVSPSSTRLDPNRRLFSLFGRGLNRIRRDIRRALIVRRARVCMCVYVCVCGHTLNVDEILLIPSVQSCLLGITKEMEMRCKSLGVMNRNYELTNIAYLIIHFRELLREFFFGLLHFPLRRLNCSLVPFSPRDSSACLYIFRRHIYFELHSYESIATPYRIRLLASPFAFSRPTEPERLVAQGVRRC